MKFDIDIKNFGSRNETRHSDDQYDYSWREDNDYSYGTARIIKDGRYGTVDLFPGEAEVQAGDEIYVVHVSYDSGDSFGNSSNNRTHLWAFSDKARAERLCLAIDVDATADPDYDFDNKPLTFDDVPICCNEWKGYFENFQAASVETIFIRRR
jgi:hypothetical protein